MPAKKIVPDNMQVWTKAFETPVQHTKPVSLGRDFTAIDAQYCIMKATELFGPVGEKWGYITETEFRDNHVVCKVKVWHGNIDLAFGPYVSIQPLYVGRARRFDTDAAKKGITDALTKCLSHLGIGGDVFMGRYDDNTYVAMLRQKAADEAKEASKVFSPHPYLTPEQEKELEDMDRKAAAAAQEDL